MIRSPLVLVPLLAFASCAAPATQSTPEYPSNVHTRTRHITVLVGERSLDDDDYAPVEDQLTFGLEFADDRQGIGWELGLMASEDSTDVGFFDVEGSTQEIYGGFRFTFLQDQDVTRPYLGLGVTYINSEVEVNSLSEDDGSIGAYVHAGLAFDITPAFFIGIDARLVAGTDLEIANFETDADYAQIGVTVGSSF